MATLQLTSLGWRMKQRQPSFLVSSAWMAMFAVLPMALAAVALVGPEAKHIQPFVELAGTDNYMAYVTIGATAMIWATTVGGNIGGVLEGQRFEGTLGSIWSTPTSLLARVAGLGASGMSVGIARTFIAFGVAWAILRFPLSIDPLALIGVLAASTFAVGAFGLIWAGVILRARAGMILVQTLLMGMGILAGPAYPTTVLPDWAQVAGNFLPPTWMIRGLRATLIFSDTTAAWASVGALLGLGLVFGVCGMWLFARFDRDARQRGHLEAF
ncbi:MAG: ABC transporter permease [Chloroflexota bacterium]|nr:ABC transporter permease [Chloroflexota bacterium]MDE2919910.1 ABC transporter permease [Chloroflexota bacterium]